MQPLKEKIQIKKIIINNFFQTANFDEYKSVLNKIWDNLGIAFSIFADVTLKWKCQVQLHKTSLKDFFSAAKSCYSSNLTCFNAFRKN